MKKKKEKWYLVGKDDSNNVIFTKDYASKEEASKRRFSESDRLVKQGTRLHFTVSSDLDFARSKPVKPFKLKTLNWINKKKKKNKPEAVKSNDAIHTDTIVDDLEKSLSKLTFEFSEKIKMLKKEQDKPKELTSEEKINLLLERLEKLMPQAEKVKTKKRG